MIITFLRSSSFQTHSICPQKFFLEYTLGISPPSSKAADKGNVVHKALEVMARVSMCIARGDTSYEDDTFGHVEIAEATPEWALEHAFEYHRGKAPHIDWERSDLTDCRRWMQTALTFGEGRYDPRNRIVIQAEQRFDFELDAPWANYHYDLADGTSIEGKFGIKGTIDLITRDPDHPGIIEMIDWKTGQRKDWSQEGWSKKTYQEVCDDPQFRLYHYAASLIYPEAEEIFTTVFYLKDGGPYSICFTRDDLPRTEAMLAAKFAEIRDTKVPYLNVGRRCTTFCHFGTTISPHDPSKTICQFFADKVKEQGIERTTGEFGKPGAWNAYGSGGGRRAED